MLGSFISRRPCLPWWFRTPADFFSSVAAVSVDQSSELPSIFSPDTSCSNSPTDRNTFSSLFASITSARSLSAITLKASLFFGSEYFFKSSSVSSWFNCFVDSLYRSILVSIGCEILAASLFFVCTSRLLEAELLRGSNSIDSSSKAEVSPLRKGSGTASDDFVSFSTWEYALDSFFLCVFPVSIEGSPAVRFWLPWDVVCPSSLFCSAVFSFPPSLCVGPEPQNDMICGEGFIEVYSESSPPDFWSVFTLQPLKDSSSKLESGYWGTRVSLL
mmetsp:Transcript_2733/g.6312  ORF Transcript_2733/g.6312 Transcript_2733/m.6312 type:complete len:273 (+) Transcript_2733:1544-2362(+)